MNAVAVICPHCGAQRKGVAVGTRGKQLSREELRALLVSDEILRAKRQTKKTTTRVLLGSLAIDGVFWLTDIGVAGYVAVGVIAVALIARSVLRARAARRRALPG
jgi:hypothetical protein